MQRIKVPVGTLCPLCPDHEDEEFVWSDLMLAPICVACSYDIEFGFDFDEKPTHEMYNNADRMDRIEEVLGIPFKEAKVLYLEESVRDFKYWQRIEENMLRKRISRQKRIAELQDWIDNHEQEIQRLKADRY